MPFLDQDTSAVKHLSHIFQEFWKVIESQWQRYDVLSMGFECFIEISLQNFIKIIIIKLWLLRVKVLLTENPFVSLIQMSSSKNWRYRPHWGYFFARLSIIVLSFVWVYSKDFFQSLTWFLILEQRSMNFT